MAELEPNTWAFFLDHMIVIWGFIAAFWLINKWGNFVE